MTKTRLLIPLLAAAAALGVSACGSSSAPGVEAAPGAGATQAAIPTTPKPPPALANKPVVAVPTGPAPKTLQTKDLVVGTGATAATGQTVTVNYVGELYKGGTEFDSSWAHNQTFTTALSSGKVIEGWVKGIVGMKVGGRRELIIPPSLGYGAAGSPPKIPANATLVFVVDLLSTS